MTFCFCFSSVRLPQARPTNIKQNLSYSHLSSYTVALLFFLLYVRSQLYCLFHIDIFNYSWYHIMEILVIFCLLRALANLLRSNFCIATSGVSPQSSSQLIDLCRLLLLAVLIYPDPLISHDSKIVSLCINLGGFIMNFIVMRVSKLKTRRDVVSSICHNLRVFNPPNVDSSATQNNIIPTPLRTREQCCARFDSILSNIPSVRSNAVLAHEFVISASPAALDLMTRDQRVKFFKDAFEFIASLHGGTQNIVQFSIHCDETTWHAHCIVCPVVAGKLNSRSVIGGHRSRLSELQTQFAQQVGAKHGLSRGVQGSRAQHVDLLEYQTLVNKTLPGLRLEQTRLELKNSTFQAENLLLEAKIHQLQSKIDELKVMVNANYARFAEPFMNRVEAYFEQLAQSPNKAIYERVSDEFASMSHRMRDVLAPVLARVQRVENEIKIPACGDRVRAPKF